MTLPFPRALAIGLGAVASTALGGCYYGDVHGASYASAGGVCSDRYYDYDPYAYGDGYGYGCYDPYDYGGGFIQIGFGGGWYDDYYYPGHGLWMFDRYRNRYPLRGQYLNYWGGRRAWWRHNRHERGGRRGYDQNPGGWERPDRDRPRGARPPGSGGWNGNDRDAPRGAPPGRGGPGRGGYSAEPGADSPGRPGRNGDVRGVPRPDRVAPPPAARPQPSAPPVERVRPAPPVRAAPVMRGPAPIDRSSQRSRSNAEDNVRED